LRRPCQPQNKGNSPPKRKNLKKTRVEVKMKNTFQNIQPLRKRIMRRIRTMENNKERLEVKGIKMREKVLLHKMKKQ